MQGVKNLQQSTIAVAGVILRPIMETWAQSNEIACSDRTVSHLVVLATDNSIIISGGSIKLDGFILRFLVSSISK